MGKKIILVLAVLGVLLLAGVAHHNASAAESPALAQCEPLKETCESLHETAKISAAAGERVTVTVFHWSGCPHCRAELEFLQGLAVERGDIDINAIEVSSPENRGLFEAEMERHGSDARVPKTIVCGRLISGFTDKQTTGQEIVSAIEACKSGALQADQNALGKGTVRFLLWDIDLQGLSLPALTIALGLIDGFNPCAMWVLVYLIAIMLETRDRKRLWLIVGSFVFASGALYFLFMTAWLNLFLFIGFLGIVQLMVGLIALGGGIFHLREYFANAAVACKITDVKTKRRTMDRIKRLLAPEVALPATILGIVAIAFSVNLIEFVCSAGIPAVYTKILASSSLAAVQHYSYILLYVFFFMLDDLLVFGGAALTLQFVDISEKYTRYAGLIGGIILILLGITLIFFPEALMFT